LPELVASAGLPSHLAEKPYLKEMYGQSDWSVRAIYGNNLGWFDGRAETLYVPVDVAAREVLLMGGAEAVLATAKRSLDEGDPAWAAHLVGKVRDSGWVESESVQALLGESLKQTGASLYNTNGRAYLLESAHEITAGWEPLPKPKLQASFIEMLPMDTFFDSIVTRVIPGATMDVHESVRFDFTDTEQTLYLTLRHGVAEYTLGEPFPGTPAPTVTIRTDSMTWKKILLDVEGPMSAILGGRLKVSHLGAFQRFMARFEREK